MDRPRTTPWVLLAGLSIGYVIPLESARPFQKKEASVKKETAAAKEPKAAASFGDDVDFLKKHTTVLVLERGDARVAICPAYQGRVMTSTASGSSGPSLGWIHREHIASGKTVPHINVYGGEDRFWIGPEGGQFSIFFKKGDPFDLEHWQTPAPIDSDSYPVSAQAPDRVSFRQPVRLVNYTGTTFTADVDREIRLLGAPEISAALGAGTSGVRAVAFQSENRLTNRGREPWTRTTGLLSIWILGMFPPSPGTTVVLPVRQGPESTLGPVVNDAYFGKVPADRLAVRDGVVFFRADGRQRGKIGVSPRRAKKFIGSYDAAGRILTIVEFTLPAGATDYVNSMWELQKNPFAGDAVNSYNDGPPAPGARPLGPFYELETSSPAAALAPGASLTHVHRTFHFTGAEAELDRIARSALGVGIAEIRQALR
jgi:hypothetical protein